MERYVFAKAKDSKGLLYYLMAETEEEVYNYCDNFSVPKGGQMDLFQTYGLAIENWASDITPAMAQSHFTWVGTRRNNPFVVAKPIYEYKDGKYIGLREFKEKF